MVNVIRKELSTKKKSSPAKPRWVNEVSVEKAGLSWPEKEIEKRAWEQKISRKPKNLRPSRFGKYKGLRFIPLQISPGWGKAAILPPKYR
jgi:hypothetical protein